MADRGWSSDRWLGTVALIAVPSCFALSELCHPITRATVLEEVVSARVNGSRWLVAHLLALVAVVFIPFLVPRLAAFAQVRAARASAVGAAFTQVGALGVAGLLGYDFLLYDAGRAGDDIGAAHLLSTAGTSFYGRIFLLVGPAMFLVGMTVMAVLTVMNGTVARRWSVSTLVGILIYGLAGPLIPVPNGHLLVAAGAMVMLVGLVGIAVDDNRRTTHTDPARAG